LITEQQRIENIISAIRDIHSDINDICLNGSCMNFHVVLRRIFPNAEPYFNIDHVITKINGNFYDITGKVNPKDYSKFTSFYNKKRTSRAFTQMINYEFKR